MPRTLAETLAWQDKAACAGIPLHLFFPLSQWVPKAAQDTCSRCPVRLRCLGYGQGQSHGVWGGLSRGRADDRAEARSAMRGEGSHERGEESDVPGGDRLRTASTAGYPSSTKTPVLEALQPAAQEPYSW